jgi:hypothetical protein
VKPGRWQQCNVLEVASDGRRLWQFGAGRDKVAPGAQLALPVGQKPPAKLVAKDWRTLVQPRLNIAWLPPKLVFLRALQLPAGDPAELPGMVEFQLEKLSPMPVAQIVWTVETVPHPDPTQQTAVVAMASRSAVEDFLGQLSGQGFLADRLEIPFLRELRAERIEGDGLWLFVRQELDAWLCLAAWYVGGVLRDLSVTQIPPGAVAGDVLVQQLTETAWAGEMNGWLPAPPPIHLRATDEVAAVVEPKLREWSGQPVRVEPLMEASTLAELTAHRALSPTGPTNLIPDEVRTRYRQQFIDGVWMRGLGAIGVAYLIFTVLYLAALTWRRSQLDEAHASSGGMALNYTNAMRLKDQVGVLQEQVNLKFAALDAWRAAVETLPAQLTLSQLNFQKGRTLVLDGSVPSDSTDQVTAYNAALKKVTANGQPLFANVRPATINTRPGAATATWRFEAELRRGESP